MAAHQAAQIAQTATRAAKPSLLHAATPDMWEPSAEVVGVGRKLNAVVGIFVGGLKVGFWGLFICGSLGHVCPMEFLTKLKFI